MLFLSREEVRDLVTVGEAIAVIEAALQRYSDRTVHMPEARRLALRVPTEGREGAGTFCFSKVCYLGCAGIVGFRVVADGPDPNQSTRFILLCDGQGGAPLALIAEHDLYQVRVGALAAVAARHLARRQAELTLGLVGTGPLARVILTAMLEVLRPARVLVASRRPESRRVFVDLMQAARAGVPVSAVDDIKDAVAPADIVVTATSSAVPILRPEWIKAGAFVYLVGAGCEADARVYRRATRIIVSDWRECLGREDVAGMVRRGELSEADVHASLHEIVQGTKHGRGDDGEEEVILVRAPGTVFHDVTLAHHAYLQAIQAGRGRRLDG